MPPYFAMIVLPRRVFLANGVAGCMNEAATTLTHAGLNGCGHGAASLNRLF